MRTHPPEVVALIVGLVSSLALGAEFEHSIGVRDDCNTEIVQEFQRWGQDGYAYCDSLLNQVVEDVEAANGVRVVRRRVQCGDGPPIPGLSDPSQYLSSILSEIAGNATAASEVRSACSCLDGAPKSIAVGSATKSGSESQSRRTIDLGTRTITTTLLVSQSTSSSEPSSISDQSTESGASTLNTPSSISPSIRSTSTSKSPPVQSTLPSTETFLVVFQAPPAYSISRRQVNTQHFLTANGEATMDCTESALFSLNAIGQLSVNGELYSTAGGVPKQLFAPNASIGNISTTWTHLNGVLHWNNTAFLNGVASLCLRQSGMVYVFLTTARGKNCYPIRPQVESVMTCPGHPSLNGLPPPPVMTTLPSPNATNGTNLTAYPIGNSIEPAGCPSVDGQIYMDNTTVTSPQAFQVQCYRSFSGSNYQELPEPHFNSCIAACDNVNGGGSLINGGQVGLYCYGVTWMKYNTGLRCFLKMEDALETHTTDYLAVSAVLLSGVTDPVVGAY